MTGWRRFWLAVLIACVGMSALGPGAFAETAAVLPPWIDPMARLDPDMAKVIEALKKLGPRPLETLEPGEARRQPGLNDALAKLAKHEKLEPKPHAGLTVSDSRFADMGNLHLRFYVPDGATQASNLPIVLYFRGGGWVIADLDDYDATPAALARKSGAAIISVDYPLAPTEKFPAQHDEAVSAYQYVLKNAKGWGYDPAKIALVGEGAGGNLALNTAIAAREQKLTRPLAVIAIHPIATTVFDTPSRREDATAKPLSTAALTWFLGHVTRGEADRQDPRLNLVAANLKDLPPVTIINAGIDPLRSDGDILAESLKEAGVETTHRVYEGVTHAFFGMDAVVGKAREAQDFAVAQLKRAFAP